MKQVAKMLVKIKRKIRCGIEAEEDDFSAVISQININKNDEIEYNIENMHNWSFEKTKIFIANSTKFSYNIEYVKVFLSIIMGEKMITYKNLWDLMKSRNLTKTELRKRAGLSSSTFAKLSRDEMVSLDVLVRLCKVLECQISDICLVNIQEDDAEL